MRDYLELFSADNKRFEVRSWAQSFCLEQDQLTETLSTGERQKLALITALALARPLLLLDEPFRGLDFESTELIRAVLGNLAAAGVLVVLTSHALEVLASVADLIYLLEDGRVNWSSAGAGDNSDISYLRGRMVGEQAEIADLSKQVSPDETPGSP